LLDETKSIGPQLAGVANDSSLHLGKDFLEKEFLCGVYFMDVRSV
jgi:hypothetical protein